MSRGRLVSFYLDESRDDEERTIDDIQSWDHNKLEDVHDYIQWLFPLRKRSNFNPDAPVLDDEQIADFRNSEELQSRLLKSFKLMLDFYGLRCDDANGLVKISKSEDFAIRSRNWLTHGNHNYLRITRILTSLRLLGLKKYAQAFFIS